MLLTARLTALPFKRFRLGIGAALGAAYAVAVVLPPTAWLGAVWIKCLFSVPIVMVSLGYKRAFWRSLLLFWVTSCMLAGIVLGIGLLFGQTPMSAGVPYVPLDLKTLLLVAAAAYCVLTIALKGFAKHGGGKSDVVTVRVQFQGKNVQFQALLDTGHSLTDPVSGSKVLVADLQCLRPLFSDSVQFLLTEQALTRPLDVLPQLSALECQLHLRLIPYHAIGVKNGLLLAFRPDSVHIGKDAAPKTLIAFSPQPISARNPYAALV